MVVTCTIADQPGERGRGGGFLVASLRQGIKTLPNAGQEQGKGLEEPAALTHQIICKVPNPLPSPNGARFMAVV